MPSGYEVARRWNLKGADTEHKDNNKRWKAEKMTSRVPGRNGDSTKAIGEKEKNTWSNKPKEANVPVKTQRSRLGGSGDQRMDASINAEALRFAVVRKI